MPGKAVCFGFAVVSGNGHVGAGSGGTQMGTLANVLVSAVQLRAPAGAPPAWTFGALHVAVQAGQGWPGMQEEQPSLITRLFFTLSGRSGKTHAFTQVGGVAQRGCVSWAQYGCSEADGEKFGLPLS